MEYPEESDSDEYCKDCANRRLIGYLWKWKGLWGAVGLSFIVEILQFMTGRGLLEFDDVIHNCLGTTIGKVVLIIVRKLISKRKGNIE